MQAETKAIKKDNRAREREHAKRTADEIKKAKQFIRDAPRSPFTATLPKKKQESTKSKKSPWMAVRLTDRIHIKLSAISYYQQSATSDNSLKANQEHCPMKWPLPLLVDTTLATERFIIY